MEKMKDRGRIWVIECGKVSPMKLAVANALLFCLKIFCRVLELVLN